MPDMSKKFDLIKGALRVFCIDEGVGRISLAFNPRKKEKMLEKSVEEPMFGHKTIPTLCMHVTY